MTYRALRFIVVCLCIFLATTRIKTQAGAQNQDQVLSITWENDSFSSSGDRGYTQGLKLSYLGRDLPAGRTADRLSRITAVGFELQVQKLGLALGQNIYTPSDLSREELIKDDRPYAGWLYLGLIYQRLGTNRFGPVLESFELDLGVIGSYSGADQAQTFVHDLLKAPTPHGWDNQLKNEPGLILNYGRSQLYRLFDFYKLRFDWVPTAGVRLGNITSGSLGSSLRFGYNIPNDFGHFPIGNSLITPFWRSGGSASRDQRSSLFGFYFFGGVEGRAVLYNTFLDGNVFYPSHHLDIEDFVADLKAGAAFIFKRLEVSYVYVYRTKEFKRQPEAQTFGSINVKYFF